MTVGQALDGEEAMRTIEQIVEEVSAWGDATFPGTTIDEGVGIEAPFPDAAWQLSGAYTKSVEMLLNHIWGIDGAWLNWFFWDKPNGRGIAIVGGVEWNIVTLDDLIEMLNAIAKPGGGIEANGGSVDA